MEFNKLVEDYGCLAFTDDVMKERIPKSTYKAFHESLDKGRLSGADRTDYAYIYVPPGAFRYIFINGIFGHFLTSDKS